MYSFDWSLFKNREHVGQCISHLGNNIYETKCRKFACRRLFQCPNYDVCKKSLPLILLSAYRGRCFDCDLFFGKNLEKKNKGEFPIFLEDKDLLSIYCVHSFCASCIRKATNQKSFDQQDEELLIIKGKRLMKNSHKKIKIFIEQEANDIEEAQSELVQSDEEEEISIEEENFLIEGSSFKCPICRFALDKPGFLVYK